MVERGRGGANPSEECTMNSPWLLLREVFVLVLYKNPTEVNRPSTYNISKGNLTPQ